MSWILSLSEVFAWIFAVLVILLITGFIYQLVSEKLYHRVRPGQRIDVFGRGMHLLCRGMQDGPTVILETGGGNSSITSRGIQLEISKFAKVCAYDRAGYGFSDPVNAARTFDDMSNDLDELLIQAGVTPPYILVGESMGGLLVRNYYRLHPKNVVGILLLDAAEEQHTFEHLPKLRKMQSVAAVTSHLARFGIVRLLLTLVPEKLGVPRKTSSQGIKELVSDFSRPSFFRATVNEIEAYFAVPIKMREAGGFGTLGSTPLIVVTHGKSFTGPQLFLEEGWAQAQDRLATLSTNSSFFVAEHSGHAIGLDQPQLVVDLVKKLIDDIAHPK